MNRIKVLMIILLIMLSLSLVGCVIDDGRPILGFGSESENSKTENNSDGSDNSESNESDSSDNGTDPCIHSNVEWIVDVEATCTEGGFTHSRCTDCGAELVAGETVALGHLEGEWIVEIEPTAEDEGLKYTICERCDQRIDGIIAAVGYSEGLKFLSNGDGTCALASRGSCNDQHVSVPPVSPDGDKVVAILHDAFSEDVFIRSIRLPTSVVDIGDRAFYCTALHSAYLSDNVMRIGRLAFFGCDQLAKIDLPKELKIIESCAFTSCDSLSEIVIPEGVLELQMSAFSHCNGITKLHIPASVEMIGDNVVSVRNLTEVTVDPQNKNYRVENNCLVSNDGLLIVGYGNCKITSGVKIIGDSAFAGNTQISRLAIPAGVLEIRDLAFDCSSITEIVIPYGVKTIARGAFMNCSSLKSVTIPSTVIEIGYWAFDECGSLSEITYCGSTEDWERINIHTDNEGILTKNIDFVEDFYPDTVYNYGRTTISGNAAYIYDLLVENVLAEIPVTEFEVDKTRGVTVEDFYLARLIFFSDHPECFWWNGNVGYSCTQEEIIVSTNFEYKFTQAEIVSKRAELESVVSEILSGVPDGSVFEKALYLHDAVAERVTYIETENDQTPYGALVEGQAVCNGYATSYQLLLQRAGIRAWTVNGTAGGEVHAWNVVWLSEGVCVYTDVTWDDQEEILSRYYFNMSLQDIDDDHTVNTDFVLPECEHYDYGFSDLGECNILSEDDGAEVLARFLGEAQNGERRASFFFTGNSFKEWFDANSTDLANHIGSFSISYTCVGNEIFVTISQ